MMQDLLPLPLPAPRHVGRVAIHREDEAKFAERARICVSAAAEALIAIEYAAPEAGQLADALDLLLPRLRQLADRLEQPELPLAS